MTLLSIIVPVYNAEKFLQQCIQSILNQNNKNFELLLINDGSTDDSYRICIDFANRDDRISIFNIENNGVSNARNVGLQHAKGYWVCFIDSDDYISPNYFEAITSVTSDFAMVNVNIDNQGLVSTFKNYPNQLLTVKDFLINYKLYPNFAGPWSKFFKLDRIKSNQLQFDVKLSFGEDAVFNLHYLSTCKTVYLSNSTSYNYREHIGSLSKEKFSFADNNYLYSTLKQELSLYEKNIYLNNIVAPLNKVLISIYTDNTPTSSVRRGRLKLLVEENFYEFMELYKKSIYHRIIKLSSLVKNYYVLNYIFSKKFVK